MPVEWTTPTATSISWQQLSAVTDTFGGVDFYPLYVNDQFPWAVNDSRPHYVIDTPTEPL